MNLEGTHVAMVTPFDKNLKINEESYRELINFLIDGGVDGLLAAGTTGESATISHEEQQRIIDILVDEVNGRVTTIAGAGSNASEESMGLVQYAEDAGADSALVITPYYNKPQQSGMYKHFKMLNDSHNIPIIAYNVPSRTGVDLSIDTILDIAKLDNVAAIKEANSDLDKFAKLYNALSKEDLLNNFTLLSGNDGLTLPMMAQGAKGVISVVANIEPKKMSLMVNTCLRNDFKKACGMANQLHELMDVLFIEGSPAPTKRSLNLMGMNVGTVRMPMDSISQESDEILQKILKENNLI